MFGIPYTILYLSMAFGFISFFFDNSLKSASGLFIYICFQFVRGGRVRHNTGGQGLIPRRLRRFIAVIDTPPLCGGVVYYH
jgi:hypothetical protein